MRSWFQFCLLSGCLWAQSARDQARRTDLNFIATTLPKAHVNFFFQLKTRSLQWPDSPVPGPVAD